MQVERELRPEFVKHLLHLQKHAKFKKYSSIEEFFVEIEECD